MWFNPLCTELSSALGCHHPGQGGEGRWRCAVTTAPQCLKIPDRDGCRSDTPWRRRSMGWEGAAWGEPVQFPAPFLVTLLALAKTIRTFPPANLMLQPLFLGRRWCWCPLINYPRILILGQHPLALKDERPPKGLGCPSQHRP